LIFLLERLFLTIKRFITKVWRLWFIHSSSWKVYRQNQYK